jgi:NAD-dependent deacetylase
LGATQKFQNKTNKTNKMNKKQTLVILTGAGISAESGIPTFRDANGLWEGHDIHEVASPDGWHKNPSLVLDFYNKRRNNLLSVKPNEAHFLLGKLEEFYDVYIITQNVDNLHELGGSKNVMHLHGDLLKSRSSANPLLIYNQLTDINIGDLCEKGAQLRPHIVWFGEDVPLIADALDLVASADIFAVIGTSMQVYPAANLIDYVPTKSPKFYIDKNPATLHIADLVTLANVASLGVADWIKNYLKIDLD